jgi:hypothetical protein
VTEFTGFTTIKNLRTGDNRLLELTEIDGGYRVKTTETHHLDVLRMLYNWRLVTTPIGHEDGWDRGWCYFGAGDASFRNAVLAAWAWDGSSDTEPAGYDKALHVGRSW